MAIDNIEFNFRQRDIEQAAAEFERSRQGLYRPDGAAKFAAAELEEQQGRLLLPLQAATTAANELAGLAEQEAVTLEQLQHIDPIAALPAAELERAGALRPFVQDYCESEPLAEVAQRLAAVEVHGTPAERALYAQFGSRRHRHMIAALRGQAVTLTDEEQRALAAIGKSAEALRIAAIPGTVGDALRRAGELRQRAGELRSMGRDALRRADGTNERFQAATAHRYKEIF